MPQFGLDLTAWFASHAEQVHRDLTRYFGGGKSPFTGRWFEEFSTMGDPNRFEPSDVLAVEALSVKVPPEAAARLLITDSERFNSLLRQIPREQDLWEVRRLDVNVGGRRRSLAHGAKKPAGHRVGDCREVDGLQASPTDSDSRQRSTGVYRTSQRDVLGDTARRTIRHGEAENHQRHLQIRAPTGESASTYRRRALDGSNTRAQAGLADVLPSVGPPSPLQGGPRTIPGRFGQARGLTGTEGAGAPGVG